MGKLDPLISIILPTYNGSKYIAESIESCIQQTYPNWELIIVNDCSTDDTLEIIRSYQKKDSRISVIHNSINLKLPRSLNEGFKVAKGDFWTWTSDDNRYKPEALQIMMDFLVQNPNQGLVYTNYTAINDDGVFLEEVNLPEPREMPLGNTVGACFLYRREVALAVGEYNPKMFLIEDYDYWMRIYLQFSMAKIEKSPYFYRRHSQSLTTQKKHLHAERLAFFRLKHFKLFWRLENPRSKYEFLEGIYLGLNASKKMAFFSAILFVYPIFVFKKLKYALMRS